MIFIFAICCCARFADDVGIDVVSAADCDDGEDNSCAYVSTLNQIVKANMLIKIVDTIRIEVVWFTTVMLSKKYLYQIQKFSKVS